MVETEKNLDQMWRLVPALVTQRFEIADDIAAALTKHAVDAWYYPETKVLRVIGRDPQIKSAHVAAVQLITTAPTDLENAICVKRANALSYVGAPFRLAGSLQGGSSPLTNTLVGGLLAGGIGYGSGALLENLFPERYVERKKLRKNMAMMGAAMGALPGLVQWNANYRNRVGAGEPADWGTFGKGLVMPTSQTPLNPAALKKVDDFKNYGKFEIPLSQVKTGGLDPIFKQAVDEFSTMFTNETGWNTKPVPVDRFNRAIWNDVRPSASFNAPYPGGYYGGYGPAPNTSPHVAAAASGLVSGVQAQYGGTPMLSPMHFVRGLATAGVDLATARIAGSVLGALGGLTPEAQNKMQEMGLWSGLIRGVTGSVLGLK